MAEQLKGFTVALAGPRKSEEMAKLVQNMGGRRYVDLLKVLFFLMMRHWRKD